LVLAVAIVVAAAAVLAAVRINTPLTAPSMVSTLPASVTIPGTPPPLPWPVVGQGAVAVPALGYAHQSGPEVPVPIASLTKMTTAVVILRDHPLAVGASGPVITITPGDALQFDVDLDNDESNVPLQVGEKLTELQMLEALLNQSANDVAYSLAVWDAGSEPAFVVKMNALAASLGATHTHYVDASGFDPQSVSTAADCLRIAAAGMEIPAFANVAGMATVSLPLVGTVHNIVTEIGSDGVVGVKSGYTSQAGGCMVLAAYRIIQGRSVLVLASALGQTVPLPPPPPPKTITTHPSSTSPTSSTTTTTTTTSPSSTTTTTSSSGASATTTTTAPINPLAYMYPLLYAGPVVEGLLDATTAGIVQTDVATAGQRVMTAVVSWNGQSHPVGVVTTQGAWLMGWPGQHVASAVKVRSVPTGAREDTVAGHALYVLGTQSQSVPLTLTATLPEPTWWWRLFHS
jgi:D-alanyl-D-alanine carboxypeptidase (penicillin-binding protein 5/6)